MQQAYLQEVSPHQYDSMLIVHALKRYPHGRHTHTHVHTLTRTHTHKHIHGHTGTQTKNTNTVAVWIILAFS